MGWPLLNLFGKEMKHIIFMLMFVPVVPAILTRNERHAVDSKTVYLWFVDHSYVGPCLTCLARRWSILFLRSCSCL